VLIIKATLFATPKAREERRADKKEAKMFGMDNWILV